MACKRYVCQVFTGFLTRNRVWSLLCVPRVITFALSPQAESSIFLTDPTFEGRVVGPSLSKTMGIFFWSVVKPPLFCLILLTPGIGTSETLKPSSLLS